MGKRSDFKRLERDFYKTPFSAVTPLLPHLKSSTFFSEPCAGDGALINHLESAGHVCSWASDIEPQTNDYNIVKKDMFETYSIFTVITNPPWDRKILHPYLEHLHNQKTPSWLLFDADWMHTKQSESFMLNCSKIISVGRVKWIEGSASVGKDNCCWYRFEPHKSETIFIGR